MRLLIKQRVFTWTDTYDIYDENQQRKYYVKSELFSFGHKIYVCDYTGREIGEIHERLFSLFPTFELEIGGQCIGTIQKKLSLFRPKYEIDCNDWKVEGDFLGWDYDVTCKGTLVAHITKEILHWGDTYAIHVNDAGDELMVLLVVLAIDAANCTNNN